MDLLELVDKSNRRKIRKPRNKGGRGRVVVPRAGMAALGSAALGAPAAAKIDFPSSAPALTPVDPATRPVGPSKPLTIPGIITGDPERKAAVPVKDVLDASPKPKPARRSPIREVVVEPEKKPRAPRKPRSAAPKQAAPEPAKPSRPRRPRTEAPPAPPRRPRTPRPAPAPEPAASGLRHLRGGRAAVIGGAAALVGAPVAYESYLRYKDRQEEASKSVTPITGARSARALAGSKARHPSARGRLVDARTLGQRYRDQLAAHLEASNATTVTNGVRKDDDYMHPVWLGIPHTRRDPVSPLAMMASANIMVDAAAAARGTNLTRYQRKALEGQGYRFAGALGMLYSPLGAGRMMFG